MSGSGELDIRTFTAPGFGENAYLLRCGSAATAVAIDPGGEAAAMADVVTADGLELDAILLTHAHLDHVEGVAELVRRTGAPVYLHEADLPLYHGVARQGEMFGLTVESPPPVDHPLEHGATLVFDGCTFQIRHVPGHSPGHVLLYCESAAVAFVGDVVFAGSIGRTDLPGGSYQQLMQSIRQQVLTLPAATRLYPGHGPATTVDREARTNPFLIPHFGGGRLV
jgi:hydroxyacylglutathione hydrolase